MRETAQKVELALDIPQYLLRRGQEAYVPETPEIAHNATAEMTEERGVRDEEADEEGEEKRSRPGRDGVRSNAAAGLA